MTNPTALAIIETPKRADPTSVEVPRSHAWLTVEATIPHCAVEVVTPEETRHEEQVRSKADLPSDFFKRVPIIEPPLTTGITVDLETLLGFLAAIAAILPPDSNYPILSSAKLWTTAGPDDEPELYLEAGSPSVWTMVAISSTSPAPRGFSAMMPVRRAKNVLCGLRDDYPKVTVGVDEHGICLGPRSVPCGGNPEDFPARPVMNEWTARAAMPAAYFREICDRVLLARTNDFCEPALQGALLDFELLTYDGKERVLCTAVATDGKRIHVMRMPQMMIEMRTSRLRAVPPTCTISAGFFGYMREVIQHEWAAIEFSEDQITARGQDFMVIARAPADARTSMGELANWRRFNIEGDGYWLVARPPLEQLVARAALGGTSSICRIVIDGGNQTLNISSTNDQGDKYSETISARSVEGPPKVDALFDIRFLRDALTAAGSGLVRLTFAPTLKAQRSYPVVIRGEDEQFKAIIMPVTEGEP